MPLVYKNCFRSQGGSVIESGNPPPVPDTHSSCIRLADGDDAISPHTDTPTSNPLRRAIKQYYFYD